MRSSVIPILYPSTRPGMLPLFVAAAVVGFALPFLAACHENTSVADIKGACAAFDAPTQPVLGKRRVDQRWIDRAVETGVTVCGWPRPKAEAVVARAVDGMR